MPILDAIFRRHAAFTIPAEAGNNPMYYTHNGRALPASTVIQLLVEAYEGNVEDAAPQSPTPSPTPVAPPEAFASVVDKVGQITDPPAAQNVDLSVDNSVDWSVDNHTSSVRQVETKMPQEHKFGDISEASPEILAPFDDKFPSIIEALSVHPNIDSLQVIENAHDHPLYDMYAEGLAASEGCLNFRCVRFYLQAAATEQHIAGFKLPGRSGVYTEGNQSEFSGPIYDGRPVVVFGAIVIGDWVPPQTAIDAFNKRFESPFLQGPFVLGDIGNIGETGDRIMLHMGATQFVTMLSKGLDLVQNYRARRKKARDERNRANKDEFERRRSRGLSPDDPEWSTPGAGKTSRLDALEGKMDKLMDMLLRQAGGK